MKQRHRDEGAQSFSDIPAQPQAPGGILGVGHKCLVRGRHALGVTGGSRGVEQRGRVRPLESLAHIRWAVRQGCIGGQIHPCARIGQHELDLGLRRARIDRYHNTTGHHCAPEGQHPVEARRVAHRDPIAGVQPGRAQPTCDPRRLVP